MECEEEDEGVGLGSVVEDIGVFNMSLKEGLTSVSEVKIGSKE